MPVREAQNPRIQQLDITYEGRLVPSAKTDDSQGEWTLIVAYHGHCSAKRATIASMPHGPQARTQLSKLQLPAFATVVAILAFGTVRMSWYERGVAPGGSDTIGIQRYHEHPQACDALEWLDDIADQQNAQTATGDAVGRSQ